MADYPEHEKMLESSTERQAIGEFIEWLHTQGYEIAEWDESRKVDHRMMPVPKSIEELLAEYLGIDRQKIEQEKRQMLANMRAAAEGAR